MSFITTNYQNNKEQQSFEPLPSAEYEMIIKSAMENATPSGAETLQITLVVRNDLDNAMPESNGKHHNRYVFNDNWKRKATKQYDVDSFQYILQAVGVPEGTQINSIDDFINVITGKPVRVYVKKAIDKYQTEKQGTEVYTNEVAPWNYQKSQFPAVQHQWKDGDKPISTQPNDTIEITDEDVPF